MAKKKKNDEEEEIVRYAINPGPPRTNLPPDVHRRREAGQYHTAEHVLDDVRKALAEGRAADAVRDLVAAAYHSGRIDAEAEAAGDPLHMDVAEEIDTLVAQLQSMILQQRAANPAPARELFRRLGG